MSASNILHQLYKYKSWSEKELFKYLKAPAAENVPTEMEKALYWLAHINIVDQLFIARLQGEPEEFDSVVTEKRQDLHRLEENFARANQWFVEYTRTITGPQLAERVVFTFTDGKPGDMSKEEILAHVLSHGLQHRGSVATILPHEVLKDHKDHFTTFLKR
ncbi:DinB family protein [Pseudomonas batumici]|uniref:DinB family protein n=1 Tax=Pseudomonas batumici TaxID=226910 RepID=UPI000589CB07|nr:DinB family protein [Pseudomonas batumici]